MGRAERRKQKKVIGKKLTDEQYNRLLGEVNEDFLNLELSKRIKEFQEVFIEALTKAFEKNGISKIKLNMIMDDVISIMDKEHKKWVILKENI